MSEQYEVIVTHPIPDEGLKDLFDRYVCHYPSGGAPYTDAQLMELIPACDAVLACGAMPARLIEAAPKLKIISNFGAGYDRVDVDAADRAGVSCQREVLPFGGTDGGAIQHARGGIPTGALSIPCRYVHSACEVIDLRDLDGALAVLKEFVNGEY